MNYRNTAALIGGLLLPEVVCAQVTNRQPLDTLVFTGIMLAPSSRLTVGTYTNEGDIYSAMPVSSLLEVYMLMHSVNEKFTYEQAIRKGVFFNSYSLMTGFASPLIADSLRRLYPYSTTYVRPELSGHMAPATVGHLVRTRANAFWKGKQFGEFYSFYVSFRYISIGQGLITIPNFKYRGRLKSQAHTWTNKLVPLFFITDIISVKRL